MLYYSTNGKNLRVSAREAVLQGLAPDNGLYMPQELKKLPSGFFNSSSVPTFYETSLEVARLFLGEEVPEQDLCELVISAMNFEPKLVEIGPNLYTLELFHGPTLAFKDFGARFLAALTSYFLRDSEKELRVLVATSGDTGSAVASGFFGLPNIKVILLYPAGKVSEIQEKQLTTMGGNVIALKVDGVFDDCQRLVKQAFLDPDLREKADMTSANSINIARLIPQAFYAVHAALVLKELEPLVFSVPSGNFGNLTASVIAKRIGAPIGHFVAATNVNDVVPEYLSSGEFRPRPSVQTVSNAMDVGNPSNFARLQELYSNDLTAMRGEIFGAAFSDDETVDAMKRVHNECRYMCDPHGAVAFLGLERYWAKSGNKGCGVFYETAHPSKFGETVQMATGLEPQMPERLKVILGRKSESTRISADFAQFKEFLTAL
ncbi:MAG: threonine synthase [Deltaproteobacteria bacterium]|nr:threonine synthase [Deltaproteobacteria bacterium]